MSNIQPSIDPVMTDPLVPQWCRDLSSREIWMLIQRAGTIPLSDRTTTQRTAIQDIEAERFVREAMAHEIDEWFPPDGDPSGSFN